MKTKLVLLAVCVAMLSVLASATIKDGQTMSGDSSSDFGEYSITRSESPMVYNDQVLETYDLKYENATSTVKIAVLKEKKCRNFIVRTDEFEIQYACTNGVFGVKKIEQRFKELTDEEMNMKLNRVSYFAQRVICQNQKTVDEYLGLIACYFPALVNEEFQASI